MADRDPEARTAIARGEVFGGDAFASDHDPTAFVEALYGAGALRVEVVEYSLVVTLPAEGEARARVIAMYNAEVDRFGEEFGGEELAGHEMTAEEAAAIGHPEAVGEWVVDDLHITDRGQQTITFWWD